MASVERHVGTVRARAEDGEVIEIDIYQHFIQLGNGEEAPGLKSAEGPNEKMNWRGHDAPPYFEGVHSIKKYFPQGSWEWFLK